jgi:photosystem II stability/assembly factor-like uncharacterized protein
MRVIVHEERYGHFPGWHNEARLSICHAEVTLQEDFPLISDFEVVLEKGHGSIRGYEVIFFSQERGNIAYTESTLRSVCMTGSTSGWAIGDNGTVLRYNGVTWSREIIYPTTVPFRLIMLNDGTLSPNDDPPGPISLSLHCVVMHSPDDGWIVGDDGYIFHFNGQKWSHMWNFSYHLHSLSLVSSKEWWAVGEKGTMMQYKMRSIHDAYQLDTGSLYSVAMLSEQDGWCFGANGTILKYNGSTWEIQPNNIIKDLRASCMITPYEGWCVGQDTTILHYQDGVWQKVDVKL